LILLQEQAIKEAAAAAERRKLEEELKNCSPESLEARKQETLLRLLLQLWQNQER
jgi:hypothetical protein